MKITSLDHLVLTVRDMDASIDFYTKVMGMELNIFGNDRKALSFGSQKINLHQFTREFEPKADIPTPGSADLCFLTKTPITEVVTEIQSKNVEILEGPVQRTGATGPILSIYFRDPDQNLIEVSNQLD
jgi:catechol 2,3-dioxygenase-like lactoylglutathione lyase family enzyme